MLADGCKVDVGSEYTVISGRGILCFIFKDVAIISNVSACTQVMIFLPVRADKSQKSCHVPGADISSTEELGEDLGHFGHPKPIL